MDIAEMVDHRFGNTGCGDGEILKDNAGGGGHKNHLHLLWCFHSITGKGSGQGGELARLRPISKWGGRIRFAAAKPRPEIWAALAHDWLTDPDAEPDKLGRYWRDIVLHKK